MTTPMLTFHAMGDWPEGRVKVAWTQSTRPRIEEVERAIDAAWAETLSRLGPYLFDGPMCRLEKWEIAGDCLHLTLSETSYKPFLGTNLCHPELADRFGANVLANPVGVSPALVSADGYLLFGRRSSRVAYYPRRVHPFSGALEPRDTADVFGAVRRELAEELNLPGADVLDLRCLGIVEDTKIRHPELIFAARLPRTKDEILSGMEKEEHTDSVTVATHEAEIERMLDRKNECTPVALATLMLWGRRAVGIEWFDRQRSLL